MLGGNLGSLLYGDVSVMDDQTIPRLRHLYLGILSTIEHTHGTNKTGMIQMANGYMYTKKESNNGSIAFQTFAFVYSDTCFNQSTNAPENGVNSSKWF